jgi:hypothetical protein
MPAIPAAVAQSNVRRRSVSAMVSAWALRWVSALRLVSASASASVWALALALALALVSVSARARARARATVLVSALQWVSAWASAWASQ